MRIGHVSIISTLRLVSVQNIMFSLTVVFHGSASYHMFMLQLVFVCRCACVIIIG